MPKLNHEYNPIRDELTVEGLRFSGDFFRFFNLSKPGQGFRILTREDGVVTIERVELQELPKRQP